MLILLFFCLPGNLFEIPYLTKISSRDKQLAVGKSALLHRPCAKRMRVHIFDGNFPDMIILRINF